MIRALAPLLCLAAAAAVAPVSPAGAQGQVSAIREAIRSGAVAERFDGYMVFRPGADRAIRNQVGTINIQRRSLYTRLAQRRGVTAEVAGIAVACQLLARVPVGGAYVLSDNIWRRRAAGDPPVRPSHCGG
jgi:uncharacterized protein